MAFHQIAYGPDEHVLLTLDGAELLAHDAQTEAPKWRLTFDHPLAGVLFADAGALPGSDGSSPWRHPSSGRCVLAVDAVGNLHVVDPMLGEKLTSLGPFGKPTCVAAGAGGVVALAIDDRVLLWRSREVSELPGRASAIAFSIDGATLAIGAADGALRFLSIAGSTPPAETFCAVVHGGITDLVQHPDGTWIAGGKSGVSTVNSAGPQRLARLPENIVRLALAANAKRLAVQLSERIVSVFAWPSLEVELRVEYMERPIHGLSFGPQNWLGIAMNHGDGNKIDVVTSATHRTDTHPGRPHRSWLLSVRGKEQPVMAPKPLTSQEAEDIRRMKDPFHEPAPARGAGNGGRVGIGVAISVALLCLRLCAAGSRSSSYSSYSSYTPTYTPPIAAAAATASHRISHVALVRLDGPSLDPTTEEIPTGTMEGETPGRIWTAPDGTVFVSTMNTKRNGSSVYRRDKTGAWDRVASRRTSLVAQMWGRSATDLFIMDEDSMVHNDGGKQVDVPVPTPTVFALGGVGDDLFITGLSSDADAGEPGMHLYRRQHSSQATAKWAPEPSGLAMKELWSGGGTIFGRAVSQGGIYGVDDRLLQRAANGRWTERKFFGATRPESVFISSVWVSPTGDAFVATDSGIFRSTSAGTSWQKTSWSKTVDDPTAAGTDVDALWGRSNSDVYGTTRDGVVHYDGKTWSMTSYTQRANVIGGTATEVLLLVDSPSR